MNSKRLVGLVSVVALALVASLLLPPTPAQAAEQGPRLQAKSGQLRSAIACTGRVKTSRKPTVLLVHGTGATPGENWGANLKRKLPQRGYPTCTVRLPDRALNDLQVNVEYVVHAIRTLHRRSGQKVAVIGHSQGAFLATYALRWWPDLKRKVSDMIGYSGTYTYGTDVADVLCVAVCTEAFQQFRPGSKLLTRVATKRLPRGPSYTAFTTLTDEIVLPQPSASTLRAPGARNYVLHDFCPHGFAEHITTPFLKPFLRLTLDALSHRGPARKGRVGSLPCGLMPEVVEAAPSLLTFGAGVLTTVAGHPAFREPRLRCYLRAGCR